MQYKAVFLCDAQFWVAPFPHVVRCGTTWTIIFCFHTVQYTVKSQFMNSPLTDVRWDDLSGNNGGGEMLLKLKQVL